eukprot:1292331-Amorphochlora_amoeboformis.AAC.1
MHTILQTNANTCTRIYTRVYQELKRLRSIDGKNRMVILKPQVGLQLQLSSSYLSPYCFYEYTRLRQMLSVHAGRVDHGIDHARIAKFND